LICSLTIEVIGSRWHLLLEKYYLYYLLTDSDKRLVSTGCHETSGDNVLVKRNVQERHI